MIIQSRRFISISRTDRVFGLKLTLITSQVKHSALKEPRTLRQLCRKIKASFEELGLIEHGLAEWRRKIRLSAQECAEFWESFVGYLCERGPRFSWCDNDLELDTDFLKTVFKARGFSGLRNGKITPITSKL